MRIKGMKKKLYLLTYDKQAINHQAWKVKKSFDEVKNLLNTSKSGK